MSIFDTILNASGSSSYDMAIDLGTANTLVGVTGQGVVINEPSVVAIERNTHRVLAVGHEAKNMINHTPDAFTAERPLRDGVVADYDITEAMISAFINKAAPRRYPWQPKPRIVICIPCGATSVEKRAVFEATIQAGARQAYLIEEPMAAAMGADLPVTEPTGSMVVDIGGGTTEVAVISLGGIVTSSSLRIAGNRLDEAIAHARKLKSEGKVYTAEQWESHDIQKAVANAALKKAKNHPDLPSASLQNSEAVRIRSDYVGNTNFFMRDFYAMVTSRGFHTNWFK